MTNSRKELLELEERRKKYVSKGLPIASIIAYIFSVVAYFYLSFIASKFLVSYNYFGLPNNVHRYIVVGIIIAMSVGIGCIASEVCYSLYGIRNSLVFLLMFIPVIVVIAFAIYAFTGGGVSVRFPNADDIVRNMIFGSAAFFITMLMYWDNKDFKCGCSSCNLTNIMQYSHTTTEKGDTFEKYKHHEATTKTVKIEKKDYSEYAVSDTYEWGEIKTEVPAYDEYLGKYRDVITHYVYVCPVCRKTRKDTSYSDEKVKENTIEKRYI